MPRCRALAGVSGSLAADGFAGPGRPASRERAAMLSFRTYWGLFGTGRFRTPSPCGERFDPCFSADTRYWLIIISIIIELRTCLPATIAFQDWEGAQDFQS